MLGALTALELRGLTVEAFGRYRPAGPLAADGRRATIPSVGRSRAGEPGGTDGGTARGRGRAA